MGGTEIYEPLEFAINKFLKGSEISLPSIGKQVSNAIRGMFGGKK